MPPFLDESIYEQTIKVMEGQYVEIGCPVNGTPLPEIVWFKNARQLFINKKNKTDNDDDDNQLHLSDNGRIVNIF